MRMRTDGEQGDTQCLKPWRRGNATVGEGWKFTDKTDFTGDLRLGYGNHILHAQ